MTAFPKADVQNGRIGQELNVRLWPKADVQVRELDLVREEDSLR